MEPKGSEQTPKQDNQLANFLLTLGKNYVIRDRNKEIVTDFNKFVNDPNTISAHLFMKQDGMKLFSAKVLYDPFAQSFVFNFKDPADQGFFEQKIQTQIDSSFPYKIEKKIIPKTSIN